MIRRKVEDRRTGHGDPAGNAVVPGPRPVVVLQLQNLLRDLRVPLFPFLTACTFQAIADVKVGKELLSTYRTETFDKPRIGKLAVYGGNLTGVFLPVRFSTAELLKGLRIFIQRYSGVCRGGPDLASPSTVTGTDSVVEPRPLPAPTPPWLPPFWLFSV